MFGSLVSAVVGFAMLHQPAPAARVTTDSARGEQVQAASQSSTRGRVLDPSQAPIVAARVTVAPEAGSAAVSTVTDPRGEFALSLSPGTYTITVVANGFVPSTERLVVTAAAAETRELTLRVAGVQETVSVEAPVGYRVPAVSSATRTPTPLRDVPQSVSVVSRALIADQRMTSMADVARYMPGVGFAQGEGNRDAPILRGNSSTSDFFVDGVRDDVQYFRDVYNVERVEALKGPNAMVFGRGGVGGVINRVTRQAEWGPAREIAVQLGSWNNRRLTADLGRGLSDTIAVRVTGLYESSDSYRDDVGMERYGVNPTVVLRLGQKTSLRAGYELYHDDRTADRGISSFNGQPVAIGRETFFGDPQRSFTDANVHLLSSVLEHRFSPEMTLRNRTSYGDYDKFYQNVFPGAVNATATSVSLSAYNNATQRHNLFNQTDLILTRRTGRIGHTVLAGAELGRQETTNFRHTGFFPTLGTGITTVPVPLSTPRTDLPIEYRQNATDADNAGVATIAAAYVQDQVALSSRVEAVVGVRLDRFTVDFRNNRLAAEVDSDESLVSPRVGLIYKPVVPLSLYGSYSLSYLPRAGEQLSSLSPTNRALDPEEFRNYELGAKWDLASGLALTAAVYRLDRGNVVVPDPNNPGVSILVDAQRTRGLELGWNGSVTGTWSIAGGYAYQDGEITRSIAAAAQAGAVLGQLPRHSLSLWNKYDLTPRVGVALGIIHRGDSFTSMDNLVLLPGYTRADAGLFFDVTARLRAQLNVENLFDEEYYPTAHSNTNITPGSPRALRVAVTTRF